MSMHLVIFGIVTMHFVTKATPISNIDGKCHNKETKKQNLSKQLYIKASLHIISYKPGDGHMYVCTHMYRQQQLYLHSSDVPV